MKVFLQKIAIISIVVIGTSTLISAGSLWALRNSSFYKPSFLVNDIQDDSFDYIILGASTGLTTLNTHIIDSIANTKGLNLSMDDTALATQYLMLQHFIAEGKSTTYCILAPSNTSYDMQINSLGDNDYRFLPYVGRDYVYNHYQQYPSNQAKFLGYSKFLPILGVSYYNAELLYPSINSLIYPKKRNRFDAKGNYSYPPQKFEDIPITQRDTFEVDFSNSNMKAIQSLCDTHGIQLICYFTPMQFRYAKVVNNNFTTINHSGALNSKQYFFDGIHVNSLGREKSSIAFAKRFLELNKSQ